MSRSIKSPIHWQHPVRHMWIHHSMYIFFSIHIIAYPIYYTRTELMSRRHAALRSPLHFSVQYHYSGDHNVFWWCAPSPMHPTASQRLRFLWYSHNINYPLWLSSLTYSYLFILSPHDNYRTLFATMIHSNTRFSWFLLPSFPSDTLRFGLLSWVRGQSMIRPSLYPELYTYPSCIQPPTQPRLSKDTQPSLLETDPKSDSVTHNLTTRWIMSLIVSTSSEKVRSLIQRFKWWYLPHWGTGFKVSDLG